MKQKEYNKRYSVYINGLIYGVFETLEEAERFIWGRPYSEMVQIWDQDARQYVYTGISIGGI